MERKEIEMETKQFLKDIHKTLMTNISATVIQSRASKG